MAYGSLRDKVVSATGVLALALSLSACGASAVEGPTSAPGDPGAWAAGALLVAAAANLPAENPTTQNLLEGLYSFHGQKFTELGGISGPKTFRPDGNPQIPYCYFAQSPTTRTTAGKR